MAIPWIVAHGEVTISGVKTDTKSPFHRRSRKDTPPTRSSKKLEFPTNCNDFIVDQRPSERWFPCGHGSANAESRTPGIGSTRVPLNRPGFPGAVHFGSVPFSPSPLRHRSIVLRQHHPPAFRLAASLRSVPNRPPQGLTSSPSPALPPGIPPSCRAKPTSTSARAASRPGFPLQSLSPPLAACSACRRRPPPPIQGLPSGSSPRTTADRHTATASSHAPTPRPFTATAPLHRAPRPPMARPPVRRPVAMVTAERSLFSHPMHQGCRPCHSCDSLRRTAPGRDESGRINVLSCRKRQRPSSSLDPTD